MASVIHFIVFSPCLLYTSGKISSLEIHELDKAETLLNEFFTRLYSDVKQVYYKKEFTDDEITYHLMFKKLIYNQLVDIDFDKESTGTQYLLEIIPFFMSCVEGQTACLLYTSRCV